MTNLKLYFQIMKAKKRNKQFLDTLKQEASKHPSIKQS